MINEVIYRGLRLRTTKCHYYQVVEGNMDSLVEDEDSSLLTLTYQPGSTSKSISSSLGIPMTEDLEMQPLGLPVKFRNIYFTLNGLKFQRLTADSHTINIVIVDDLDSRVIQSYEYTTIVVSKKDYKNPEFINFLFSGNKFLYIRRIGKIPENYEIRDFPKLIVDSTIDFKSDSETVYSLRKRHNDYTIREIDYQDQFVVELRRILKDYGIELVRWNKETPLVKTSYVTYQFNQTPIPDLHPRRSFLEKNIIPKKQAIDFILHTPDMVLFHDFKTKYENVNLLTNFCNFKTPDRYGDRWTAAVKWTPITEDFNHQYQPDDNSNFAYQCQFRCEIYFYEVYDSRYNFLEEISWQIELEDETKNKITEDK